MRLGIAYSSVPDAEVLDEVERLTDRMAAHDPGGVRRIKTSLRRTVVTESADDWFARALAADPLPTTIRNPIAATD